MSAPLPNALRARFQKLVEEGLSGRAAALRVASLPPPQMALAVSADDHDEVAGMLDRLGVNALVVRPDFYCFGADESARGDALGRLVGALRDQLGFAT